MSLTRIPLLLCLTSCLWHGVAHADEPCRLGDTDCEERKNQLHPEPEEGEPRVINVSGLVPLKELNRQPYAGVWFADFRYHEADAGISIVNLGVKGKVRGSYNNGQGVVSTVEDIEGASEYGGLNASYYFPLVGYTRHFSVGLVPEFHALLGGVYSGSSSSALNDLHGSNVGTALAVPVYLMARLGRHASRYGDWPVSFGAGVGANLFTFNFGDPVEDSGTFIQPQLKFEAAYRSIKVGYAMSLGYHDNFASNDDTIRLSYMTQIITLNLMFQADPED